MLDYANFVNGRFVPSRAAGRIRVTNPSSGAGICSVPDSDAGDVADAVAAAAAAQPGWARRPAVERAAVLHGLATAVRRHVDPIARVITEEQGKTLGLARVEVGFTADYIDYMAEWARRVEGEIIESDRAGEHIFLFRHPIGVVAGILPWNFPFFLIARKAAPALATGNTIVIKPSEETPHNAVKFCEVMVEAGVPPGLINIVHGRGDGAGRRLASSPRVGMVSFTGSVATGAAVMAAAAPNVTKVNLELGGKAPAIVMADADLDLAAKAITASRVINSGQVCNCAERVYVQRAVADALIEKLTTAMSRARFGDPLADESVDYGPLINEAGFRKVDGLVQRAVADGATLVTGGRRGPGEGGYYYEPTVLANCRQDMGDRRARNLRARASRGDVRRRRPGHRLGERLGLRPHVVGLHPRPQRRPEGVPRDPVRRNVRQPGELRSHAGLPRGLAEERHWRRRREARPARVHADARRLHPDVASACCSRLPAGTRKAGADGVGTKGDCEVFRAGARRAEPGHDRRLAAGRRQYTNGTSLRTRRW